MTPQPRGGMSVEHVIENPDLSSLEFRAVLLHDLHMAAYGVQQTLADETGAEAALVNMAEQVIALVEAVSLDDDGTITFDRQCDVCSGWGRFTENGIKYECATCHSTGVVTLEPPLSREAH